MNNESLKDLNHEKPVRQNFGKPKTMHFSDTSSNKTEGSKNFSKLRDRQRKREAASNATASELASQRSGYQGSQRSQHQMQAENDGVQMEENNFMAESKINAVGDDTYSSQRSLQELALPPLPD